MGRAKYRMLACKVFCDDHNDERSSYCFAIAAASFDGVPGTEVRAASRYPRRGPGVLSYVTFVAGVHEDRTHPRGS
ncbi:MAG: hypothetical protein IKX81_02140 [Firmicutes bacterium]|nr:hypothetical protein [Bacillota bacterium]